MNSKYVSWLLAAFLVFTTAVGCSDSNGWDTEDDWKTSKREDREKKSRRDKKDTDDFENELDEALSQLGDAFEDMGDAFGRESEIEPVDFRDLRDVLPGDIRGLEKGKSSGEKGGALGFRISQVEQKYESEDGDSRVEISIVDLGGLRNVAAFGLDWLKLKVDREDEDGYERTRTYRDHPVIDKCRQMSRYDHCEMTAFVSRRFVVKLESWGLERGGLEDVMEDTNIRKLERMKDEGVGE